MKTPQQIVTDLLKRDYAYATERLDIGADFQLDVSPLGDEDYEFAIRAVWPDSTSPWRIVTTPAEFIDALKSLGTFALCPEK